jgi:ketosteroid isomerase-like protein
MDGQMDEIWESWRIEGLELRSSGDDKALALFRTIAKGKGSGIELTREDAVLGEFRGGKIVKVGYYNDQQQALEAAGCGSRRTWAIDATQSKYPAILSHH